MLALIGLRMLKRNDPLNAGLGRKLFKLLDIFKIATIEFEMGLRLVDIDITCHFKAHARLALQCNGGFSGVFAVANDDGGANPEAPLLQHKTREHTAPHNGEHGQAPHNEPPKSRRVPARGGHQRHV